MFGQRFPSGSGSRLESWKDKSSHSKRGIVARFVSKGLTRERGTRGEEEDEDEEEEERAKGRDMSQVNSRTAVSFIPETSKAGRVAPYATLRKPLPCFFFLSFSFFSFLPPSR